MSGPRREVRATQSFFAQLDELLGDERGSRGEPNSYDFQSHELFAIIERFAEDWERLPRLIAGRDDYRILIGTGMLVAAFSVTGQLAPDDAVELTSIEIDIEGPT